MSAQLAEGLLAVIWLDRCRQAQRLTEGRAKEFREEVVRVTLTSFIAEQRWGVGPGVVDDEGAHQAEGVFNFDAVGADYWLEEMILARITNDILAGAWKPIYEYMRILEFFASIPRGSLRQLPEGAPSR